MQNFTFWNPTKVVFGKDTVKAIGKEARAFGRKALLVYGRSSIKRSGVYDKVVASLKDAEIEIVEYADVKSNPVLSHTREGIELARREGVELIVAVGGGSVIDESKSIAAGVRGEADVWDYYAGTATIRDALPLIVVLTLAATGSEMNNGAVLTNEDTLQKFNIGSPHLFPKVSILDPTATYSVPARYTAYSAADAITHLLEGYFTSTDTETPIQDRFVESLVETIMASTERILKNPEDYEARATMMWAATWALNGFPTAGIGMYGFPSHMIEHSLSALYDVPHGAGLSIVLPAWMRYTALSAPDKLARFTGEVFGMYGESQQEAAEKGIEALKDWFERIDTPTSLASFGIHEEDVDRIAENATMLAKKWRLSAYTKDVIAEILRFCL
ncbi:MAG: iron-containing alcohol dehydrogenase [Syntrophobacteraceae bacterium]